MYTRVAKQLDEVRRSIPEGVGLVAVSKFHPVEALRVAYDAGHRRFGESRVQELLAKQPRFRPPESCRSRLPEKFTKNIIFNQIIFIFKATHKLTKSTNLLKLICETEIWERLQR